MGFIKYHYSSLHFFISQYENFSVEIIKAWYDCFFEVEQECLSDMDLLKFEAIVH